MPIETEHDETGVRVHTVTGPFSFEDVRRTLENVYSLPDFDPDAPVLWDLRLASADFPTEDVRRLAEFVGGRWGVGGRGKAAIVVTADFEFGMARMYQALLEGFSKSPARVFRKVEEARRWLAVGD